MATPLDLNSSFDPPAPASRGSDRSESVSSRAPSMSRGGSQVRSRADSPAQGHAPGPVPDFVQRTASSSSTAPKLPPLGPNTGVSRSSSPEPGARGSASSSRPASQLQLRPPTDEQPQEQEVGERQEAEGREQAPPAAAEAGDSQSSQRPLSASEAQAGAAPADDEGPAAMEGGREEEGSAQAAGPGEGEEAGPGPGGDAQEGQGGGGGDGAEPGPSDEAGASAAGGGDAEEPQALPPAPSSAAASQQQQQEQHEAPAPPPEPINTRSSSAKQAQGQDDAAALGASVSAANAASYAAQQQSQTLSQMSQSQQPPASASQSPLYAPGLMPAKHPYMPRRAAPSAFMRGSPLKAQIDMHVHTQRLAALRAASARKAADGMGGIPAHLQRTIKDDTPDWLADSSPPWGATGSAVSDLEALDTLLDQLVVLDTRMCKALLRGPMISFETVIPDTTGRPRGAVPMPPPPEDEKDKTFLTGVKGIVDAFGQPVEEEEEEPAQQEYQDQQMPEQVEEQVPPPIPDVSSEGLLGQLKAPLAQQPQQMGGVDASRFSGTTFGASIPNTGMHPSLTRAYIHSKLNQSKVTAPPPLPPTSENLLRSRPPPFIAAPSYDLLCQQIRDVQRQYTCGTTRGVPAAGSAAQPGAGAGAGPMLNTNAYISGLDGPSLDEVVTHQDLPISLEHVRPTFVALRKTRSARPSSPGRGGRTLGPLAAGVAARARSRERAAAAAAPELAV